MPGDETEPSRMAVLDAIGEFYVSSPTMRTLAALAGLVPLVSVLDEAVIAVWNRAKDKRFRTLLDELRRGEEYLTEELIQKEEFIYAFVSVARSVVLTNRAEKIRTFAQLLINACRRNALGSESFEDNLKILDELTQREVRLLLLYKKHEDRFSERMKAKVGSYSQDQALRCEAHASQWGSLAADAENELGIPQEHLTAALTGLARTGLYEFHIGVTPDDALGTGFTGPRFVEFVNWIVDEDSDQ